MTKLIAFHGSEEIKHKYVARIKEHAAADEIVKGRYWQGGKGCAVGCTIHSSSHAAYETELGIPSALARIEDTIFENLQNSEAKNFPLEFLEAIPVGADLLPVAFKLSHWIINNEENGLIHAVTDKKTKEFFTEFSKILLKEIYTTITQEEREAFRQYAIANANATAYARYYAIAIAIASAIASAYASAYANAKAYAYIIDIAIDNAKAAAYTNTIAWKNKLLELLKNAN